MIDLPGGAAEEKAANSTNSREQQNPGGLSGFIAKIRTESAEAQR
jgi:hypothetical protein